MRVFLHTRTEGMADWTNEYRDFARIPAVGEYLTLSSTSEWYEVQLVVHIPFDAECDAEVYAVQVDHMAVMSNSFPDMD